MLRKSTALMFMLVMTILITLKHPVLGYCLCEDIFVAGAASCPSEEKTDCQHCQSDETHDDCMEHLNIDVGDFIWSSSDDIPAAKDILPPPSLTLRGESDFADLLLNAPINTRGDPPPGVNESDSSAPLFLKHSVLRL